MKRGKPVWGLILLFLCTALVACTDNSAKDNAIVKDHSERAAENREPKKSKQEITLTAVGDILIHERVYEDAKIDGKYDFMPMLEHVEPFINDSTVAFANQETMIGGDELGLSTYPRFNSPHEIGDALKDIGINVVSLANNHTLDRGEEAVDQAIEYWKFIDMMYTGAFKSQEDSNIIRVLETKEGISIAFLAYTYGTNGIPVPTGKDYLVNLIEKQHMADVIALSLHFGNEYERMPSEEQKELVQFAANQGVDIVLGHHPHVLQPMEWVIGKNGNKTLAAYSLGNFLSGQYELYRRIGGILHVTITKNIRGEIEVIAPQFTPTFVKFQDDDTDYEVLPMYQLSNNDLAGSDMHYEEIKAHMSQWMPELEFLEK
ncbi:CapA family protein [Virgibacillus sp. C22-A2]|uniref:CapA family protein n=1 Tax=Virgibacillus tibetensis TaxID=3042313 RepID=A0ABU6KHL5_9BACI|nr:CapA family protein [Virgibacillus sp. C22-A2]